MLHAIRRRVVPLSLAAALGCAASLALEPREAQALPCGAAAQAEAAQARQQTDAKLAANDFAGAEAQFQRLVATGCTLTPSDHQLGGTVARMAGDIATAITRYTAGGATSAVQEIHARFGKVFIDLRASSNRNLTRVSAATPLGTSEENAGFRASGALRQAGKYHGYLSLGSYTAGGVAFVVTAGGDLVVKP